MKLSTLSIAISTLCLTASYVEAKPPKPALAEIEPVSCDVDSEEFVSTVDVEWLWVWDTEDEFADLPFTKFGGDADVTVLVDVTDDQELPIIELDDYPLELSFSVSMANEEEDQTNELTYECGTPSYDGISLSATCTGSLEIVDIDVIASDAAFEMFELDEGNEVTVDGVVLNGVKIKAMDPSVGAKKMKRQKYPLVSLCEGDED
ncbi:hypothetical protein [Vibrio sonorensis]|uniref:hypothetical protein n=1 Tax=Vibrio sonorensis TaxID=1004316 RepID=UPI0008DADA44|nr:hypothetical protein [Vibrio sonorensis]